MRGLVPPRQPVALEAALRDLIANSRLRRRLAVNAPGRAHQLCDPARQESAAALRLTGMIPVSVPA
jgi:hypothetical protein